MKKTIAFLVLVLTIAFIICSCGKKEPQTGIITPDQSFDNAGFTEIPCKQSGTCEFIANDISKSSNITWEVYVLKKKFDDNDPRLILQSSYKSSAVISSTGSVTVKNGDFLYIYCSENSLTVDSKEKTTKDATLSYSIQ